MMSLFERVPGAIVADGVLQHLGSPLAEQRALAQGKAVVPRADRVVVAVGGEDRLTWLDSLSSQALARLVPGDSTELLILDPQGRVEHAAAVLDDGETTWLIVDRDDADGLLGWLTRMRFRLRVDPRIAADVAVVGGRPSAVAGLAAVSPTGVPLVWRDPWPGVAAGGWGYAAEAGHPAADWEWSEAIVPVATLRAVADEAVAGRRALAGVLAAEALRIAAWRPSLRDADERTLPHELDWLRTAVHLSKGCYRGQETVAKVHNLGHPPRRVVMLALDGSDGLLPEPGDDVLRGDDVVGGVVASARHHEDGPIALAVVRRNVPADEELTVRTAAGAMAAAQEVIVPTDAGATASVPRLPRLGAKKTAR